MVLNFYYVVVVIACRDKRFAHAGLFFRVVDVGDDDRHVGSHGNVVKSAFPAFCVFSCPFGGYHEGELFVFLEFLHHLFHHVVVTISAVDGYAAHVSQQRPEGETEELFFDEYARFDAENPQ